MEYWRGGYVQDLLIIISLIAVAAGLRRLLPPLQKLGMPDALIAGALGIILGPAVLGLLPFDPEHLEVVIYHALALIFITVSLQSPPPGKRSGTARSIAFAIPAIAVLQAVLGLGCVLVWNTIAGKVVVHPGVGVLLPLGFNQGPGPAMTFGSNWEAEGLDHGAQIGLIMAALGYAWCCVIGVGVVAWGRRRGWHLTKGRDEGEGEAASADQPRRPPPREAKLGGLEPLTAQIVAMAIVYLATWIFLELVAPLLPEKHQATIYAFHFLIATGFALALRPLAARLPGGNPLDNDLLARTSSLIVDVATCAALAAVSVQVLGANLLPILLITSLGGVMTLLACLWMARRAFPTRPFEHSIITFGALTGTATTGLALLRMLDPQLEGPSARNYVLAVTPSALLGLPLLVLIQMPVIGFPDTYPAKALTLLGILLGYVVVLVLAWRFLAPVRFGKRPWKIWDGPER
jgi:ESS family glutamate:Na+ symporter